MNGKWILENTYPFIRSYPVFVISSLYRLRSILWGWRSHWTFLAWGKSEKPGQILSSGVPSSWKTKRYSKNCNRNLPWKSISLVLARFYQGKGVSLEGILPLYSHTTKYLNTDWLMSHELWLTSHYLPIYVEYRFWPSNNSGQRYQRVTTTCV